MKQGLYKIAYNTEIARDTFQMVLHGDTTSFYWPGQFVNIAVPGFTLRRPISVCDWEDGACTLIYKTVGGGTKTLAACKPGETLDMLTGLGNGYDLSCAGDAPLLVGGGAGVPPLYGLAKRLAAAGIRPTVILGFRSAADVFYDAAFEAFGSVALMTEDGNAGLQGYVTDAPEIHNAYTQVFACGPLPMLRAVFHATSCDGQYSFEERMGCGFGACMGCTCKTTDGAVRICREGPVLRREQIVWPD